MRGGNVRRFPGVEQAMNRGAGGSEDQPVFSFALNLAQELLTLQSL
jgi:hypothetical protein